MTTCILDADTFGTLFTVVFLLGCAAAALWAGQRGPAENLSESHLGKWE